MGGCGIKNESLIKYHAKAATLARGFAHIIFEHILRTKNEEADRLSKLATTYYDELQKEVYIEVRDHRAYKETPVKAVVEEPQDWRIAIARFLQGDYYLRTQSKQGKSSREVSGFVCMRESCIENPSKDHCCYAYHKKISKRCYMKYTSDGVAAILMEDF
ncbi:hypothetical protein LIER_21060 [Lithospermum erythrorhizon]|uniref:RNase H type-1 domain-containing protein n=1 Tax=Lithospermum erythrorhizon TaxID=34254 RepID=A0AAV3QNW7_LITER